MPASPDEDVPASPDEDVPASPDEDVPVSPGLKLMLKAAQLSELRHFLFCGVCWSRG